jgi:ComF family protein
MGPYQGLLRDVVLRMKRVGGDDLADVVGTLWARQVATRLMDVKIEVVLPVPMHWWSRWKRGFNQIEGLARSVAGNLGASCRPRWLRCVRRIGEQKALPSTARWENVRNAFRCRPASSLAGKTVLLVDDVMTTGATLHEAARAIRVHRPARILAAVLAHGQ